MNMFSWKVCMSLLLSDSNIKRLDSYQIRMTVCTTTAYQPSFDWNNLFHIVKKLGLYNICLDDTLNKNYFANNLEEQLQHEQSMDNDVQTIPPPIGTPTTLQLARKEGEDPKEGKEDRQRKLTTP